MKKNTNQTLPTNFIKNLIEKNIDAELYKDKKWGGKPGPESKHK